jgi:antibiotic biosynthesis monooxygenase (ABM) superfamily enzyme
VSPRLAVPADCDYADRVSTEPERDDGPSTTTRGEVRHPPRWKLAIVTWFALFPSLLVVSYALAPFVERWPRALQLLMTSAILVPLMTWILLPAMTRAARPWLDAGLRRSAVRRSPRDAAAQARRRHVRPRA